MPSPYKPSTLTPSPAPHMVRPACSHIHARHSYLCHVDLRKAVAAAAAVACGEDDVPPGDHSAAVADASTAGADASNNKAKRDSKKRARAALEGGDELRTALGAAAPSSCSSTNFFMVDKYGPLLCAEFLTGHNLLVVERPWLQVMTALGDAFHRKRFGK
jgi:hypothetical protein